jgi:hypothetical protein
MLPRVPDLDGDWHGGVLLLPSQLLGSRTVDQRLAALHPVGPDSYLGREQTKATGMRSRLLYGLGFAAFLGVVMTLVGLLLFWPYI